MKSFLFLIVSFCAISVFGQSTMVNAFNYNSTSRDTVVEFPTTDHNQYKKVIMHYSMRCKDGLVSSPAAGQRDRGCGEWDYSCNTNIVDSTRVDSMKSVGPDYVISGVSEAVFSYTTQPTYITHRSVQRDVNYTTSDLISIINVGDGTEGELYDIGLDGDVKTHMFLVTKEMIESQGITAGKIGRMRMDVFGNSSEFENLRISMRSTSATNVSTEELYLGEWQEVYQNDIEMVASSFLDFYQNFDWDGSANILVKMSYESSSDNPIRFTGETNSDREMLTVDGSEDRYLSCGGSGKFILSTGIPEVAEEITISFWSFGADALPVNTSIVEAVDAANQRQVNIHLPWSNGQVYWDCGNDGGGYDRINLPIDPSDFKNKWTHWTFTKNANTGIMKIYMNGEEVLSGTGKTKAIDIKNFTIGASFNNGSVFYHGYMDDLQVWNKELDATQIKQGMRQKLDQTHPDYANLQLYYDFDDDITNEVVDQSSNNNNAILEGSLLQHKWKSHELIKNVTITNKVPNFFLLKGNYQFDITERIVDEQRENLPARVDKYILQGNDRVLDETFYYYAAGDQPILNEDYEEIGVVEFPAEDIIFITDLNYYSKAPMMYELMSFVTPYGIYLDLGIEGKTWSFDVTEFGPILKGKKRLFMNRGGQWQEDIDIRFEFIEGTPVRNVIDINQTWPVVSTAYTNILNNFRFEPRQVEFDENTKMAELKSTITGHGQEGEFIPRIHTTKINGTSNSKQIWTECSDNPIYPQGGTWVYDRAGWCPGAPSDVNRFNITDHINQDGTNTIDYSINTATGDSRYIVNVQLIEYGSPNFTNDVELVEIRNPSSYVTHGRYNPACQAPVIKIRNNGTQTLTQLVIDYGFDDNGSILLTNGMTYTWNGNLEFLEEVEIELPFMQGLTVLGEDRFRVILNTNDEDMENNTLATEIMQVAHYEEDLEIQFKTNNAATETSYRVYDQNGNIVLSRTSPGLSSNTIYRDTLKNINGCYTLEIEDSGQDGLSWWANNDGDGYVAVKEMGGPWNTLPTDFGAGYKFDFTAGVVVSSEDILADEMITIYPNPVSNGLYLDLDQRLAEGIITITNEIGQEVHSQNINNQQEIFISEITKFTPGIYHITVRTENSIFTQRFVKM